MGEKREEEWVSPNVIIILADDLGIADVSYSARRLYSASNGTGYFDSTFKPAIETPELDELAEHDSSGIQLINAFTHQLCGPSRSALATGRLAHKLGNPFPQVPEGGSLDVKYKTIGHEFRLRGYSTHFVGKWGIDYPRPSAEVLARKKITYEVFNGKTPGMGPTERGFDTFYGMYSNGHNHFTKEVVYKGNVDWHKHNQTHRLDYPDIDHHPTEYSTDLFTKEAIEVMQSWSPDKPGFLQLSFTAPHDPVQAPEDDINHESCRNMKNWRRKTYCGMITAIDRNIGNIKRALKDRGLADNTIILFSTDNGGAPPSGGFNYPYRGMKNTYYEGGFRTPAFLYLPSASEENSKGLDLQIRDSYYSNTMHIADFGPTLLGLVDRISGNTDRIGNFEALGNDIDGVDHTEYLLHSLGGEQYFSSDCNINATEVEEVRPVPRNGTVLGHDAFMESAAYLEGEWKLILGAAGQNDRFFEPKGYWYDQQGRPRYVLQEAASNFIDRGLGPNYYVYGWAMRFMIEKGLEMVAPTQSGNARKIAIARSKRKVRNSLLEDARIFMKENETLPAIDFDNFEPTEIQLYNLKSDPYEDNNVAYQNQELVTELYGKLMDQVKNDPGHHFSAHKVMVQGRIKTVALYGFMCWLVTLVLCFILVKCLSGFRKKKSQNVDDKKVDKEEIVMCGRANVIRI